MVVSKPLRSGQKVYARGADLIVMAMVNRGAEVIADGNIHVYAPLRGKAMAGARGNTSARIFALALEPELVTAHEEENAELTDFKRRFWSTLPLSLAVFILAVPTLTSALHTPAESHERVVSVVVSIIMLALFALSLPAALARRAPGHDSGQPGSRSPIAASPEGAAAASRVAAHGEWPLAMAIGMLAATGIGAAFVSEWFVSALQPAMDTMGINEVFAGLVIVAIAGNAVENVVGIQLAAKNQMDYGVQVILQSPVQIALTVAPIVCLSAAFLGQPGFDLVLSPLLLAAMVMSALVAVLVTFDGESNWFEGAALIALYIAIATAFWWG